MRAYEFIIEGGWATTVTQGTVISPSVVKKVLSLMDQFVNDFNSWLAQKELGPIQLGKPTGSTAYHDVDPEDKVYGDIDLQMIAPQYEEGSQSKHGAFWNKLAQQYIQERKPKFVHPTESTLGHPIIEIAPGKYVQLDFMWHTPELSDWGAARVTPEHNVKGLLTGNMYSVLGEILDMSIQHAGVQLKTINGEIVPFSKQKGTELATVTKDPSNFIIDTFKFFADRQGIKNPKISDRLENNPGTDVKNVTISRLVNGIKGFAESVEMNGMFGKGDLSKFQNKEDFISRFVNRYNEKAEIEMSSAKRDKATTPDAIERAKADIEKVKTGLNMVMGLFDAS